MNKILTVIITVIVCAAVAGAAYYFVIQKNNASFLQSTSPNILYLTNPVTSFSGTIENISGNNVTVSSDMILSQPLPLGPAQTTTTTTTQPQTKKITYQITVSDKTFIIQAVSNVPYLFKQVSTTPALASPSAAMSNLTIRDIKVGQVINASSNVDLRTLSGNQFEATSINVSPNILSLNGKITDVNGNTVTFTGAETLISSLTGSATQQKEYKIIIDQNTEISGTVAPSSPVSVNKPVKFSLSDLKKDLPITVYAERTSDNQTLKALLVIPVIFNLPATVPPSTQSGTVVPK